MRHAARIVALIALTIAGCESVEEKHEPVSDSPPVATAPETEAPRGKVLVLMPPVDQPWRRGFNDILRRALTRYGWEVAPASDAMPAAVEISARQAAALARDTGIRYVCRLKFEHNTSALQLAFDPKFSLTPHGDMHYVLELLDAPSGMVVARAERHRDASALSLVLGPHGLFAHDLDSLLAEIVAPPRLGLKQSAAPVHKLPHRNIQGLDARGIDELLALPEDQIDIATAALLIQRDVDPYLDLADYRSQIDDMAATLLHSVNKAETTRDKVAVVAEYLGKRFEYSKSPSSAVRNRLHTVLDTRKGACLGVSTLYLSICERLEIHLDLLVSDDHAALSHGHGHSKFYLESTNHRIYKHPSECLSRPGARPFDTLGRRGALAALLVSSARALEADGKLVRACHHYEKALTIRPQDPWTAVLLARLYRRRDESYEAIHALERFLKLAPENATAWIELAMAYDDADRLDDAAQALEKALAIDPDSQWGWILLVLTNCQRREFTAALDSLRRGNHHAARKLKAP